MKSVVVLRTLVPACVLSFIFLLSPAHAQVSSFLLGINRGGVLLSNGDTGRFSYHGMNFSLGKRTSAGVGLGLARSRFSEYDTRDPYRWQDRHFTMLDAAVRYDFIQQRLTPIVSHNLGVRFGISHRWRNERYALQAYTEEEINDPDFSMSAEKERLGAYEFKSFEVDGERYALATSRDRNSERGTIISLNYGMSVGPVAMGASTGYRVYAKGSPMLDITFGIGLKL